jgi:hypothetical protein
MPCALCQVDRELQNSHIFPEFLYRYVYDTKHRLEVLDLGAGTVLEGMQQGLRERLLCRFCEQLIGRWEHYASQLLFHRRQSSPHFDGQSVVIGGVDYPKFKLFLLSLLWRAGVSTLPAFRNVRLGPHEERLRLMLLAADPGPTHSYPTLIRLFLIHTELARASIIPPWRRRVGSHKAYSSVFAGILCTWVVSSHVSPSQVHPGVLSTDGQLPLLFFRPGGEHRLLQRLAAQIPDSLLEDEA